MKIKKIPYLGHYLFTGLLVLALAWVSGTNSGCGGGGGGGSPPSSSAQVSGNSSVTVNPPPNITDLIQGGKPIPLGTVNSKGSITLSTNQVNIAPIDVDGQSSWDFSLQPPAPGAPVGTTYTLSIRVTDKFGDLMVPAIALPTTLQPGTTCTPPCQPGSPNCP